MRLVSINWVMEKPLTRGSSPKLTTTGSPNLFILIKSHNLITNCLMASASLIFWALHLLKSTEQDIPHGFSFSNFVRISLSVFLLSIVHQQNHFFLKDCLLIY